MERPDTLSSSANSSPAYSGPDERLDEGRVQFQHENRRRGPKNFQRTDARLQEEVSERVMYARHVDSSEVTVSVRDALVTLEGTVPERWMRYALENLAIFTWGVLDVDNRIRVARPRSG